MPDPALARSLLPLAARLAEPVREETGRIAPQIRRPEERDDDLAIVVARGSDEAAPRRARVSRLPDDRIAVSGEEPVV